MDTKKVQTLLSAIISSDLCSVEGSVVMDTNVTVSHTVGNPENQIAHFSWRDDNGHDFSVTITEEGLSNAVVIAPPTRNVLVMRQL